MLSSTACVCNVFYLCGETLVNDLNISASVSNYNVINYRVSEAQRESERTVVRF